MIPFLSFLSSVAALTNLFKRRLAQPGMKHGWNRESYPWGVTRDCTTNPGGHADGESTWPVIEPTIKDLAYAQKSPAEKQRLPCR